MNWEFLLLLACPLMMVVCMKGMFIGDKSKEEKKNIPPFKEDGLRAIQIQMAELVEQNHKLTEEVNSLKKASNTDSKVVQLDKDRKRINA